MLERPCGIGKVSGSIPGSVAFSHCWFKKLFRLYSSSSVNKSKAANFYEKLVVNTILSNNYDITKNGPNSTIFFNNLPILFKSVHHNLYMNYTLSFHMIFGKRILFRDPK